MSPFGHHKRRIRAVHSKKKERAGRIRPALSGRESEFSGGYVGSEGKSELRLTGCTIECLVIARDDSTLILEDCEGIGDVRAVGKGTVRLIRTKVSGAKKSEGSGRIVEK